MDSVSELVRFQSDENKLLGRIVYPKDKVPGVGILFLHGGGEKYGKDTFDDWQDYLAQTYDISSLAFDFRGAPRDITDPELKSEGDFVDSTLNNRLIDAQNALDFYLASGHIDPDKLALGGVSMGGHVALRLTEKNPDLFKFLVLVAPAAYGLEVEDKKHNGDFKTAASQPNSWVNSPAFSALEKFKNPRLIYYGQNDQVIPRDVQRRYARLTPMYSNGDFLNLPGTGHGTLGEQAHYGKVATHDLFWSSAVAINDVNIFRVREFVRSQPEFTD